MSETTTHYDAIIIGFGKGGKTLAATLAARGQSVALVEKSASMYGGTCINVACIPTKSLVHRAAQSAVAGGTWEERQERYAQAIARKEVLTATLRGKNYHKVADAPTATVIDGTASFVDARHVSIAREDGALVIEGEKVFINTGSRPFVPPIPGLADSRNVFVSETLLDLETLPRELVIIGGGYIGLEFASMYANFGSHVSIVADGTRFLPREDEQVAGVVLESLRSRGIDVLLGARTLSVRDEGERTALSLEVDGEKTEPVADAVLVATGRRPNVEGLALEKAGVELTERGAVRVDEHLRTTAPGVWAMGDVVGGLQFTYVSLDDFRIVASDVLGDGSRTTKNRGAVPYSVFIDPPFSRVGLSEGQALAEGYAIKVATLPAAAIPKANVLEKPVGLLKVVIDADTDLILGAHLFCEESHETINLVKLAMDAHVPYTTLRDSIYTHPTMTEALNDLFAAVK